MLRILGLVLACAWAAGAADVTGKWNVTAAAPSGREFKAELLLQNEGGKLSGTMSSSQGTFVLEEVKFVGGELSYKVSAGAGYTLKFKVAENSMRGNWTSDDGATGAISATRAGAAAAGGVAGRWKGQAKSSGGREYNIQLEIAEENGKLTGTLGTDEGSVALQEASLEGSEFSFKLATDEGTYTVKLAVSENAMKGTYSGPGGETGNVTVNRT